MTKLLDQCNCQAKQNINELTKTIRSDIILTKLVIEWMRNQQLDQQYSLILKKAESWLRKAVASEKVDESKLKEL